MLVHCYYTLFHSLSLCFTTKSLLHIIASLLHHYYYIITSWQWHRTGSRWSPDRTLPVAPLSCDLGFVPNSRGNKAAANLRPTSLLHHHYMILTSILSLLLLHYYDTIIIHYYIDYYYILLQVHYSRLLHNYNIDHRRPASLLLDVSASSATHLLDLTEDVIICAKYPSSDVVDHSSQEVILTKDNLEHIYMFVHANSIFNSCPPNKKF